METDLHSLQTHYAKWGISVQYFVELLDDLQRQRCLALCQDAWQDHIFALDYLPWLYTQEAAHAAALWRLVGDEAFQQAKLTRQSDCYRPLPADVRTALDCAVQHHNLPAIVRFGFLLPQALFRARFAGGPTITRLAKEGRYDAALRHVELLTDPLLVPVRYRLLLIIAWLAALNSKRDDPSRAAYHGEHARQALQRALHTPGHIDSAWSPVLLRLAEALLAAGISEATEVLLRFGGQEEHIAFEFIIPSSPATQMHTRFAGHYYLVQLAQTSALPIEVREGLIREAEALVHNAPSKKRLAPLAYIASAYAAVLREDEATRVCEGLVQEFEAQLGSGKADPELAGLAELVTDTLRDLRNTGWAAALCSRLLPSEALPPPFRGYVLACVGERLWALGERQRARQVIGSAVSAVQDVRHPLARVWVLRRVVKSTLQMQGQGQGRQLFRLLRLTTACLGQLLKRIPDAATLEDWYHQHQQGPSEGFLRRFRRSQQAQALWDYTTSKASAPPEEFAWIQGGTNSGWPGSTASRELRELVCTLSTVLAASGPKVWQQAEAAVSRFLDLWEAVVERDVDRLPDLLDMAWQLDRAGAALAERAVQLFVQGVQLVMAIRRKPPTARQGKGPLSWQGSEHHLIEYLARFALTHPEFWDKHRDQLTPLVPQLDTLRPGFGVALQARDLSFFQSDQEDDPWEEMQQGMDAYRKGVIRPQWQWVDRAADALARGDAVEAAARFEADALAVAAYEAERQSQGLLGLTLLALARQLGQCQQVERASEIIRLLMRHRCSQGAELLRAQPKEMEALSQGIVHILTENLEIPLKPPQCEEILRFIEELRTLDALEETPFFVVASAQASLRSGDLGSLNLWLPEVLKQAQQPEKALPCVLHLLDLADECRQSDLSGWAEHIGDAACEILEGVPLQKLDLALAPVAARRLHQSGRPAEAQRIFQRGLAAVDAPKARERGLAAADALKGPNKRAVALAVVARELDKAGAGTWGHAVTSSLLRQIDESVHDATRSDQAQVNFLCQVAEALSDCAAGARAHRFLAQATDIAARADNPSKQHMFAQVAEVMVRTGQGEQVLALVSKEITDPETCADLYLLQSAWAASHTEAENVYALLQAFPADRRGHKWVVGMAELLGKLAWKQGWPSQWSQQLAALVGGPSAESFGIVDVIVGELVSLCPDEDQLLATAAVCLTSLQWPERPPWS